ncbi:hypothetical protein GCY78_05930, partial [Escherichia coli]|nr:hypothetical protein [Escherichia coli]
HKSTQQVRTQGPIRHADCRQRKLADFLCTGGIIQGPINLRIGHGNVTNALPPPAADNSAETLSSPPAARFE